MAKIHLATEIIIGVRRSNPACGRVPEWADMTWDVSRVTCKVCLRKIMEATYAKG